MRRVIRAGLPLALLLSACLARAAEERPEAAGDSSTPSPMGAMATGDVSAAQADPTTSPEVSSTPETQGTHQEDAYRLRPLEWVLPEGRAMVRVSGGMAFSTTFRVLPAIFTDVAWALTNHLQLSLHSLFMPTLQLRLGERDAPVEGLPSPSGC